MPNIPGGIFKGYDIRGIYPEELNEENIVFIVRAIYLFFQKDLKSKNSLNIVLSRDMRLSSPSLFDKALNTLLKLGAHVIDIGLASTPTFYFAIFKYKYDGGIQISASHNPKEYNGLKIVKNSPSGLIKIGKTTGMDDIKKLSLKQLKNVISKKGKLTKKRGLLNDEVKNALILVGNPEINKFKVVADAANAMGATYIKALFKKIPGKLIKMNFRLDGNFPIHHSDPLQIETLVDLQKRVLREKADLGLAPDGDGDRLFFIDEKGQVVPPSVITGLVAKELLGRYKDEKILADIRYIVTPKKIVEEHGGQFIMTKVGHAFITESLHETGGLFAGESSGHYFFKSTGNAESQIPVILLVLSVMTREGKTLSQIVQELKKSHESGEINFKIKNAKELIEILKNKYFDGEISTLDGIAVSFADWRFSLRSSNTEPLMRLNVEVLDLETAESRKEEVVKLIKKHGKFD